MSTIKKCLMMTLLLEVEKLVKENEIYLLIQ